MPLSSRACILKLKVKDRSLCLLQVYAPNAVSKYQAFVSTILLGDFNSHSGTDSETWKSVTGKDEDPAFNENCRYLLQLYCSNGLCIMNTFFQHRDVHKYTWYRLSMAAQKPLIGFCIVLSDLFLEVLDVLVKQGAELSPDHHLVVYSLQFSKSRLNRKLRRSSVAYRIKWEALADRGVRKQFVSSMAAKFQQIPKISKDIEMK